MSVRDGRRSRATLIPWFAATDYRRTREMKFPDKQNVGFKRRIKELGR